VDRLTDLVEFKVIAFVDCCGFTAYTDAHGDSAALDVYLALRRAVQTSASAAGVTVVKWTGDGAMLAAASSSTALTALYGAMLIMRESGTLALRAGATVGYVQRVPCAEVDYVGAAVNKAARLCAEATPWQLRVSLGAQQAGMHFTLRST
jgi:adenylate cyclase